MKKKIMPIVLFCIVCILALFIRNEWLRFLVGFLLMLNLVLWIEVHYVIRKIRAELEIPSKTIVKNQTFPVMVHVHNYGNLPIAEMLVRVAVRVFPDQEEVLMTGRITLDAKEEGTLTFDMDSAHCGCMEIRLERISCYDHLGIFVKSRVEDRKKKKLLFIMPQHQAENLYKMDYEITPQGIEGSETRKDHFGEDIVDIREYAKGDPLKIIYWKLTARLPEVQVKELGLTGEYFYWIYINLEEKDAYKIGNIRDRKRWDILFEQVEQITYALLEKGMNYHVLWWNQEVRHFHEWAVKNGTTRMEMMRALLQANGYHSSENTQIAKEFSLYEMEGNIIEINLQGNITSRFF